MRPWLAEYPARYVEVLDFNEIVFDVSLGFNISIRYPIYLELDDVEGSMRIFLKRRLEHLLSTAKNIYLKVLWGDTDDARVIADIDVDGEDLIDILGRLGFF